VTAPIDSRDFDTESQNMNVDVKAKSSKGLTFARGVCLETKAPTRRPSNQDLTCWQGFSRRFRGFRVSMWNHIGPSLSFPALDDLQRLCAFVDVHEEMLLRGGVSLEALLGPIMLSDFKLNVERARFGVSILRIIYPKSFPFALICQGACFLLNMKMQLVEEQYERGLLLEDDKKFIVSHLERQLVDVTKFCPPYLFS